MRRGIKFGKRHLEELLTNAASKASKVQASSADSILEESRVYLGSEYPKMYFTPREIDCAKELLTGKTIKEIGHTLGLSPRSIEYYIKNMRYKLSAHSKRELVRILQTITDIIFE